MEKIVIIETKVTILSNVSNHGNYFTALFSMGVQVDVLIFSEISLYIIK